MGSAPPNPPGRVRDFRPYLALTDGSTVNGHTGTRDKGCVVDSAGLEVLSNEECIRLLSRVPVGRIVYTDRALPAVQPVTFVVDGWSIVIRTASRSRLAV